MKNKKGFTLIELLVVIALTISILGIAIVSFINISEKKKKEAWDQVQGQIETAATEYFTANEYLFEGLSGNLNGEISVGKLVKEDYLSKIINPITGKSVSACAVVKVEKTGNKLTATFDETTKDSTRTECESNNSITVSEPGAPNISGITVDKLDGKNNPYNNWYQDGAKFTLNVQTGGNGAISSILSCKTTSGYCEATEPSGETVNYEPETSYKDPDATVCFSATNTSNKTSKKCETVKVDNSLPNCAVSKNPNTNDWINTNVTITGICTDTGSGCKISQVTTIISDNSPNFGTTRSPGAVEDNVGHKNNCATATVYVDKEKPTCNLEVSSYNMMANGWYLGKTTFVAKNVSTDVKKWIYYTDQWNKDAEHTYNGGDITGPNMTGSGNRTVTVSLTDRAGNVGICSKNVRLYNQCDEVTYKDGNSCSKPCGGTKNQLAYDKYTNARCSSKDKDSGGGSCTSPSCTTTAKPTTTTSVCAGFKNASTSNMGNYVGVSVALSGRDSSNKTISKVGTSGTKASFTFRAKQSGITIKNDISGAFCGDNNTCASVTNHSSWNVTGNTTSRVKEVWCDSNYGCKSGWEYVTSCAHVSCDSNTRTVCFRRKISNTSGTGSFSSIK